MHRLLHMQFFLHLKHWYASTLPQQLTNVANQKLWVELLRAGLQLRSLVEIQAEIMSKVWQNVETIEFMQYLVMSMPN